MSSTSTTVLVNCDICTEEMTKQGESYVCWPCKNFIPSEQLYRYAEHVTIEHKEADSGN